jgi:BA14K-like protein
MASIRLITTPCTSRVATPPPVSSHFKTYDAATGTFVGADGKRHPC